MTKEKYIECYKFCLNQGWVHNTPECYVEWEYFDSEKGRQIKYETYLKKIKSNEAVEEVHILIGEAPPYYPNKEFPDWIIRKYFYDEVQSMNTGYFKEPCKHFLNTDCENISSKKKECLLDKLANKGVLIFDIFPFPIYQSTDIREKITWGCDEDDENAVSEFFSSRVSKFNDYLNEYFENRFRNLLDKIKNKKIKIYMFAPKLASVQFLYWLKEKIDWMKYLVTFEDSEFKFHENVENEKTKKTQKFINNSLNKFVLNLAAEDKKKAKDFIENILKKHPIFMNGSGNPDFNNFVNGKKNK